MNRRQRRTLRQERSYRRNRNFSLSSPRAHHRSIENDLPPFDVFSYLRHPYTRTVPRPRPRRSYIERRPPIDIDPPILPRSYSVEERLQQARILLNQETPLEQMQAARDIISQNSRVSSDIARAVVRFWSDRMIERRRTWNWHDYATAQQLEVSKERIRGYIQELQREYRVYDSESDEYESTINNNEEEEEL